MFEIVASGRFLALVRDAKAVLLLLLLRNWRALVAFEPFNGAWNLVLAISIVGATTSRLFRAFRHDYAFFNEPTPVCKKGGDNVLGPLIIPCRTSHTRLIPTKHSFSYSYLYVGIPVGWKGPAGSILSADNDLGSLNNRTGRRTWFATEAEDYLERGSHADGLRGKLRDYLLIQGVSIERYSHAFLVTAPRFLGFSFNPVSFWYLYDAGRKLTAMILEVNNTFDERRMYFMERQDGGPDELKGDNVFRQTWDKDFHVSPFNDRDGGYSLSAFDPANPDTAGMAKVDNTIVLKSLNGKPKLVARVYSAEPPLAANNLTRLQTLSFVARWWWVGFMTNPRILREARMLWVKKLQVFYRPEVFITSIGRNETSDESLLENVFRTLLLHLIENSSIEIQYIAAAGEMRAKVEILTSSRLEAQTQGPKIEVRVLTPAFYAQLARSSTVLDAFQRTFFEAQPAAKMVHISQPALFKELLESPKTPRHARLPKGINWSFLTFLRHLSGTGTRTGIRQKYCSNSPVRKSDSVSASELDLSVISLLKTEQANQYCGSAARVLIADRIAFGFPALLGLYGTAIWLTYISTLTVLLQELLKLGSCSSTAMFSSATAFLVVLRWNLLPSSP